jgi:iron complex outermembrane recepter protein
VPCRDRKIPNVVLAMALTLASVLAAAQPPPSRSFRFDIPTQPLGQALREYGQTAGQALIFTQNLVEGMVSRPLRGEFTPEAALDLLLKNTGLATERSPSGAIMIRQSAGSKRSAEPRRTTNIGEQVSDSELYEVMVTAQKRSERFVDVPMSLSVVTGERLSRTQSTTLQDIVNLVPGLQLIATSPTGNLLTIRGISIGAGSINASVATYVDETPYTTEGPFAASALLSPNLDPYDMARVEVLRGPQGTLYGANALSGLLKYVTNAPDPSGFSASVLTGGSVVEHGGAGYDFHGMVNLPLSETVAVRLVGGDSKFPGFIDAPNRGQHDTNSVRRSILRASLLWQPSDDTSVRLNVAYQKLRSGDAGTEDVEPGTLRPIQGDLTETGELAQPTSVTNGVYNATVLWTPNFGTFLSSTSFATANIFQLADQSEIEAPVILDVFHVNYGAILPYEMPEHSFTQEFRWSSPQSQRLHWVVGGYLDDEFADEHEPLYLFDRATGAILTNFQPALGAYHITSKYMEYAAFGNTGYRLTPALEIEVGGRYSKNTQQYHQMSEGVITGTTDFVTPSSQDAFTYSTDLKYKLAEDTTTYARLATGFVPGGPNDVLPGSSLPPSFRSSSTTNYELGVKGSLARGLIAYDLDAFCVNWRDIQLGAVVGTLYGIINGGRAQSRGLEGAITYHPSTHLMIGLNAAYTDARLTTATPGGGQAGDRLPQSPFFSSNAVTEGEWPLRQSVALVGGLDWHYQTNRMSELPIYVARTTLPAYSLINLRLGFRLRNYEAFMYVKNAGDARVISSASPESLNPVTAESAFVLPPRTLGISLGAKY